MIIPVACISYNIDQNCPSAPFVAYIDSDNPIVGLAVLTAYKDHWYTNGSIVADLTSYSLLSQDYMNEQEKIDAAAIRADFEIWSGGFPPESVSQIHSYCGAARPKDSDYDEVFAILRMWMDEEDGRS